MPHNHLCAVAQKGSLTHEYFYSDMELVGKWAFMGVSGLITVWQGLDNLIKKIKN